MSERANSQPCRKAGMFKMKSGNSFLKTWKNVKNMLLASLMQENEAAKHVLCPLEPISQQVSEQYT